MSKKGTLYGIGTGPGSSQLLTVEAIETIKKASVIFVPGKNASDCLAFSTVKDIISEDQKIVCLDLPMTKDPLILKKRHEETAGLICAELEEEKDVAFLTIGDPVVYSTYMYIHEIVLSRGYEAKLINGVTSFCSVAARLGISLGSQDEEIHIIPASYDIADCFSLKGTLVFMKSGSHLCDLKKFLANKKQEYDFDFYAVSDCSLPEEKIINDLENLDEKSSYLTVVIVKNIKTKTSRNYSFFQNRDCEYFPCHKIKNIENFNCLFCYCPLYFLGEKCGGAFEYTKKGIKSCVKCVFPHQKENYDEVNRRLTESGLF